MAYSCQNQTFDYCNERKVLKGRRRRYDSLNMACTPYLDEVDPFLLRKRKRMPSVLVRSGLDAGKIVSEVLNGNLLERLVDHRGTNPVQPTEAVGSGKSILEIHLRHNGFVRNKQYSNISHGVKSARKRCCTNWNEITFKLRLR